MDQLRRYVAWLGSCRGSKVSSNSETINAVGLAKFPFEVALLAKDDSEMNDAKKRDRKYDTPPCVERQCKAEVEGGEAQVERIAREAKRAGCDNRRGRKRGVHVRPCGTHRAPS